MSSRGAELPKGVLCPVVVVENNDLTAEENFPIEKSAIICTLLPIATSSRQRLDVNTSVKFPSRRSGE